MDNRFFSPRHWSQSVVRPRCSMNDGGNAQNHKTPAGATPKVVQIPVRFVNSEPSRPDSALKIQKVFRGFLIRRRVKKILELKEEADKIEDRMSRSKIVELIQKDHRERLRINEMLMSLLFKLDSICSVDAGVRVCRKAVIKKVISLQERLDAIADQSQTGESQNNVSPAEINHEVVDSSLPNPADEPNQNLLDNEIQDSENNLSTKEPDPEMCSAEDGLGIKKPAGICEGDGEKGQSDNEENYDTPRDEFEDAIDSGMKAESEEDTNVVTETGENQNIMNTTPFDSECMEETMGTHSAADNNDVSEKTMEEEEENGGQKKEEEEMNNQQVLKKLMEDNQTMMNMMTQLFERNEMQTQMLNTLRNKVELLEKAFVCDRMRKKKKRHSS